MRGRIRCRVGLKMDNEALGTIAIHGTTNPFSHLFLNGRRFTSRIGRKRVYVAVGTPAVSFAPIAIRARKMPVDDNLEYTLARVFLTQIVSVALVGWSCVLELHCHSQLQRYGLETKTHEEKIG